MADQLQEDLLGDLRAVSGLPLSNGNQCKQLSSIIFSAKKVFILPSSCQSLIVGRVINGHSPFHRSFHSLVSFG